MDEWLPNFNRKNIKLVVCWSSLTSLADVENKEKRFFLGKLPFAPAVITVCYFAHY